MTTLNLPSEAGAETFYSKGKYETLSSYNKIWLHREGAGESHFQGHKAGDVSYRRKSLGEIEEKGGSSPQKWCYKKVSLSLLLRVKRKTKTGIRKVSGTIAGIKSKEVQNNKSKISHIKKNAWEAIGVSLWLNLSGKTPPTKKKKNGFRTDKEGDNKRSSKKPNPRQRRELK